jgi:hypothetical protein
VTRWGHAHTFTAGLLAGLILDHQAALLFGFGLALGALVVACWQRIRTAAAWVATTLEGVAGRRSS